MTLNKYKLGSLMIPFSQKCGIPNLTPYQVSGVNKDKEFFEPSHQVGEDTSKYQIVPPRHFACNLMHVGRDRVLPIAYNHSEYDKVVSPAYTVFSLKESCGVLDDYFFIMLKCEEQDRYFWFHADASVRDGMSWSDFCDVEITVPDLTTQQKYVDIYKAMVANQQSYERVLEDLKLVCDGYIEDLRKKVPCEKIGKYLVESDKRNTVGLTVDAVRGLSTGKEMIPTKADMNGVGLDSYKVVEPRQIAYVPDTSRRGEKVSLGFNNTDEEKSYTYTPSGIFTLVREFGEYANLLGNVLRPENIPELNEAIKEVQTKKTRREIELESITHKYHGKSKPGSVQKIEKNLKDNIRHDEKLLYELTRRRNLLTHGFFSEPN